MPVLLVVTSADDAAPLVRWSARLARARDTTLAVLYPTRGKTPQEPQTLPLEDPDDSHPVRVAIRAAVQELGALFQGPSTPILGPDTPVSQEPPAVVDPGFVTFCSVSHPDAVAAVLEQVDALAADLLVVGKREGAAGESIDADPSVRLLSRAPCHTLVVRALGTSGQQCNHILLPAAGGPHARVALGIAAQLAERDLAVVTPLYVARDGAEAQAVGEHHLRQTLDAAGVPPGPRVKPRVEIAHRAVEGIARVAAEGFDLVLVGASDEGLMHRMLFGTIPDELLSGPNAAAVAVLRRARPLSLRAREAVESLRARLFPQLERADRIDLFERLQQGTVRFDADFICLLSLSTAIASLGLIQSSTAVVIGAMLVAPLMTPMIAIGLALVQGNVVLARDGARSVILGFLLALSIGYAAGVLGGGFLPEETLTPEILARGSPSPLDLFVAFFSGVAAAYAVARSKLTGALVGVAIAAALVPPIGAVGISLAHGEGGVARGAALLFTTNLVAIVLGSAATFWTIGVHGGRDQKRERLWVRRALLSLGLALVGVAVPLISQLTGPLNPEERAPVVVTAKLRDALERTVEEATGATLLLVSPSQRGADLDVLVSAAARPPADLVDRLSETSARVTDRPVRIHLVAVREGWATPRRM